MVDAQGYLALAYTFSVLVAVGLAVYAFVKGYMLRSKIGDTEAFITARGQVQWFRIGWSFYAGAVGAWVLTSPAGYASYAGMMGLVFYALAAGSPFLMIAYAGDSIRNQLPHVMSLTDFSGWRYGELPKACVVLVVLFNMSIALLAEYFTIGKIFKYFVKSAPYPMVIVVGILTLAYTAYGGLLVSIFTDTIQGIASVLFFFILAIYMAATFRPGELPQNQCDEIAVPGQNSTMLYCYDALPCKPYDAFNYYPCISGTPQCSAFAELGNADGCPIAGYSSILTMPLSLFAATVFSEAMWQRAWASQDKRNLRIGAWVGCAGVIIMVFFAGLTGLLTAWAENPSLTYAAPTEVNYNGVTVNASQEAEPDLYLFQVLYKGKYPDIQGGEFAYVKQLDEPDFSGNLFKAYPSIQNWIGVILVVLAVVMNEGAVDSIQNGMTAAVTSYFEPIIKQWNLWWTRGVVVVLNAALVGIGAWLALDNVQVSVIQLFLITNQLSICFFVPVLVGLSHRLHRYLGGGSFLFSGLFSVFCLSLYGVNYFYNTCPPRGLSLVNPDEAVDGECSRPPSGYIDNFTGKQYNSGSFASAMYYTWIGNGYAWDFFLVPACVSVGSLILCAAFFALVKDVKPIANKLQEWGIDPDYPSWGIKSVANHGHLYEEGHAKRFGGKVMNPSLSNREQSQGLDKESSEELADAKRSSDDTSEAV